MRRGRGGFTLLEVLLGLALLALALAVMVSTFDWSGGAAGRMAQRLMDDFTAVESAVQRYYVERGRVPTSLDELAPLHLYAPRPPAGISSAASGPLVYSLSANVSGLFLTTHLDGRFGAQDYLLAVEALADLSGRYPQKIVGCYSAGLWCDPSAISGWFVSPADAQVATGSRLLVEYRIAQY